MNSPNSSEVDGRKHMRSRLTKRIRNGTILLLLNAVVFSLLVYGCECYLRLTYPGKDLPIDGVHEGRRYTWGHFLPNGLGFRERFFEVPKPESVFRIMILGDSLTWGVGLAEKERYTLILERMLDERFPERKVEVLNFGMCGWETTRERDLLRSNKDTVQPDLIVVGFCMNDTQPKSQDWSEERQAFEDKHKERLANMVAGLASIGLERTGQTLRNAVYGAAESVDVFPPWYLSLQRTYETDSEEWQAFVQALTDIMAMSEEMGLSSPIFFVLNQGIYTDRPTDYGNPDALLELQLKWFHQAEEAARQVGYVTCNVEEELARDFRDKSMAVNVLDNHPNAAVNQLYAQALFELIEAQWDVAPSRLAE